MTETLPRRLLNALRMPFSNGDKIDWPLVVIFCLIHILITANALLHDPRINYDGADHLKYVETLSQGRLPDQEDTREFFSPPLPYLFAGMTSSILHISAYKAARVSQLFNILLSMGLFFYLLKACLLISPQPAARLGTMVTLGILPVYYRSFALLRGEVYVAFFAVLVLYLMLSTLKQKEWGWRRMIPFGIALGLAPLSRQWGFSLFIAVGLMAVWEWLTESKLRKYILRGTLVLFITACLVGGWFYASLYLRFGSITAFNRLPGTHFSFSNQPLSFYTGLGLDQLFVKPLRPSFSNQFWPMIYSDTWGDYWAYFTVYGIDTRDASYLSGLSLVEDLSVGTQAGWLKTNYVSIAPYLSRANLVSLLPSVFMVFSVGLAFIQMIRRKGPEPAVERKSLAFLLLFLTSSVLLYGWFLILYPNDRGDTIKAAYYLHVYPYLAVLSGLGFDWVKRHSQLGFVALVVVFGMVFAHNLPSVITHYSILR